MSSAMSLYMSLIAQAHSAPRAVSQHAWERPPGAAIPGWAPCGATHTPGGPNRPQACTSDRSQHPHMFKSLRGDGTATVCTGGNVRRAAVQRAAGAARDRACCGSRSGQRRTEPQRSQGGRSSARMQRSVWRSVWARCGARCSARCGAAACSARDGVAHGGAARGCAARGGRLCDPRISRPTSARPTVMPNLAAAVRPETTNLHQECRPRWRCPSSSPWISTSAVAYGPQVSGQWSRSEWQGT